MEQAADTAIYEGMPLSRFRSTLPGILIHELMHFESRDCHDTKLPISEITYNEEAVIEQYREGDMVYCYGDELCRALARSSVGGEQTIHNADSLTLLFIMIWLTGKYPEWDWTSGHARLRD